jgi:hypothetical protein
VNAAVTIDTTPSRTVLSTVSITATAAGMVRPKARIASPPFRRRRSGDRHLFRIVALRPDRDPVFAENLSGVSISRYDGYRAWWVKSHPAIPLVGQGLSLNLPPDPWWWSATGMVRH